MKINKDTSFISTYFDNKSGDDLMSTITPNWSEENTKKTLEIINVPKDAKNVCEIGCGVGRLLREISDSGVEHCVGLDASSSMIEEGKKYVGDRNIKLLKVNGDGNMDFGMNGKFDFVFSIITFQHIPNTDTVRKYLEGSYDLLKKGGTMMFQVLTEDYDKGGLWSHHELDKLGNHLMDTGFIKLKVDRIGKYGVWSIFRCEK